MPVPRTPNSWCSRNPRIPDSWYHHLPSVDKTLGPTENHGCHEFATSVPSGRVGESDPSIVVVILNAKYLELHHTPATHRVPGRYARKVACTASRPARALWHNRAPKPPLHAWLDLRPTLHLHLPVMPGTLPPAAVDPMFTSADRDHFGAKMNYLIPH